MKNKIDLIIELLEDNTKFSASYQKNKQNIDIELDRVLHLSDGDQEILSQFNDIIANTSMKHESIDNYIRSVKLDSFEKGNSNSPLIKIAHYLDINLSQLDTIISLIGDITSDDDDFENVKDNVRYIYEENPNNGSIQFLN